MWIVYSQKELQKMYKNKQTVQWRLRKWTNIHVHAILFNELIILKLLFCSVPVRFIMLSHTFLPQNQYDNALPAVLILSSRSM